MRVIVFFDLPTETLEDRANYRRFRKVLLTNGFIMLQESVYCRLLITPTMAEAALQALKRDKPPKGLVMALKITEKQFQNMEILVGDVTGDVVDTDERLVVL